MDIRIIVFILAVVCFAIGAFVFYLGEGAKKINWLCAGLAFLTVWLFLGLK